jgi:hypothetical protein
MQKPRIILHKINYSHDLSLNLKFLSFHANVLITALSKYQMQVKASVLFCLDTLPTGSATIAVCYHCTIRNQVLGQEDKISLVLLRYPTADSAVTLIYLWYHGPDGSKQ